MSVQKNNFFSKFIPFIGIGIFLVIFVVGFVLLSYLILIGAAIGIILFCFAYIKTRFFSKPPQRNIHPNNPDHKEKHRIYEHKK